MKIKIISMILIFVTSIDVSAIESSTASCWADGRGGDFNTSIFIRVRAFLIGKNLNNAEEDVLEHVKIGDYRFIAAKGFVLYFPGAKTPESRKLICKFGWKVLSNTGDTYENLEKAKEGQKLVKYALDYNSALINELGRRGVN